MTAGTSLFCQRAGDLVLTGKGAAEIVRAITDKGAASRFRAKGGSMYPVLRDGDILTVAPAPARIRLGSIVAIAHPDTERLVVHRVIALHVESVVTKGDNLADTDGVIPQAAIVGRVSHVERGSRRVRLGVGIGSRILALWCRRHRTIDLAKPLLMVRKLWTR